MDGYLNKYIQNISEFIQFVITVFLLKLRKFYQVESLCLVEVWEVFSHSEFVVCLFGSRFEFLRTRLFPPLLSSSPSSLHPSSPLPYSPAHDTGHPLSRR